MSQAIKYVLAVCLIILAGCASLEKKRQQVLFEELSREYENALLFGDYPVAINFLRPLNTTDMNVQFGSLKKIKITSYEPRELRVSEDRTVVTQTVDITYYHLDYMIETSIVDSQLWKYSYEDKTWYLQSGLPDFQL
jgi:uncharacterized membrane protein